MAQKRITSFVIQRSAWRAYRRGVSAETQLPFYILAGEIVAWRRQAA